MRTAYFPGFAKLLFGRSPITPSQAATREAARIRDSSFGGLGRLFGGLLRFDQDSLRSSTGTNSRRRTFPVETTFWAFLWQVMNPASSCREVVQRVQAERSRQRLPRIDPNTSGYCQARRRLPLQLLNNAAIALGEKLESRSLRERLWCGRRVQSH